MSKKLDNLIIKVKKVKKENQLIANVAKILSTTYPPLTIKNVLVELEKMIEQL